MTDPLALEARGLTVVRGARTILDDVSVSARAGQLLAVTGPSGAGKSTLLSVLGGFTLPDSGEVGSVPEGAGSGVALVPQGFGLLTVLTAAENVELPLQIRGLPRRESVARAHAALERAGLPGHDDRLVEALSGGQQQRVSVARALVVEAAVVIADEPTSELDAVTRDLVLAALRAEATRGAVVIIATHDEEVATLCDAVLHLVDGRVAEPGA